MDPAALIARAFAARTVAEADALADEVADWFDAAPERGRCDTHRRAAVTVWRHVLGIGNALHAGESAATHAAGFAKAIADLPCGMRCYDQGRSNPGGELA